MLHKSQTTTKQYDIARKSKHHQTVGYCTKVKTPPNSDVIENSHNNPHNDVVDNLHFKTFGNKN